MSMPRHQMAGFTSKAVLPLLTVTRSASSASSLLQRLAVRIKPVVSMPRHQRMAEFICRSVTVLPCYLPAEVTLLQRLASRSQSHQCQNIRRAVLPLLTVTQHHQHLPCYNDWQSELSQSGQCQDISGWLNSSPGRFYRSQQR